MSKKSNTLIHPDSQVSDIVLKHWLKVNGFPHTAANAEDLAKLLVKLVQTGTLTKEQLNSAVLEIEETGGKRIFLRYLLDKTAVRSQEAFEKHLKAKELHLDEAPTATKYVPRVPMINYISWEQNQTAKKKRGDKIRIKFSETQARRNVDWERGTIQTEKVTKFIIATVELGTGFTCIFIDSPEFVHRHKEDGKSKRELYEQFYFDWIADIFDSRLEKVDLEPVIDRLVHTEPHVIRIPNEKVKTGGNSRQIYASVVDVRYDPARQGAEKADGTNWKFQDLAGYWIPDMSEGRLQRALYTRLIRANSMIQVLADCLAAEVDYVISRIK